MCGWNGAVFSKSRTRSSIACSCRLQILPLLRSATNNVSRAVELSERVATALPPSWAARGLPKGAAPLLSFVEDLLRRAESSRKIDAATVQRLAQLAAKLSGKTRQ